ncbi:MAG TPA: hypothetical protein VN541_25145, partial [Tepidisphaeraceae bacterium]|nr:hypothetical protein [Tepidisphaeraceae bacterium]
MRKDIDRDAQRVERHWNEFRAKRGSDSPIKLADAQFFVAREHGFASWPRFASHLEVIKALLEHGADVHARENDLYHADPLGWALIRWSGCSGARYKERYVQAVALLVAAGATFDPAWYE